MTKAQLTERIAKATEKMEKKQNTITKKEALIEKKKKAIEKLGFTYEEMVNEHCNSDSKHDDAVWIACDIKWLYKDIERIKEEIPNIEATIEKYNKQLTGEMEKEELWAKEMPEQFKALKDELVVRWDETDKKRREFYTKRYEELGWKEFYKLYSRANAEMRYMSDEDIHKSNLKDAELLIIDLYNRVKEITGEVTDWSCIHAESGNSGFPVLTGIVHGKDGRANVETILAGGYNIQKLHIRTLVHSI